MQALRPELPRRQQVLDPDIEPGQCARSVSSKEELRSGPDIKAGDERKRADHRAFCNKICDAVLGDVLLCRIACRTGPESTIALIEYLSQRRIRRAGARRRNRVGH